MAEVRGEASAVPPGSRRAQPPAGEDLDGWALTQATNARRHLEALRPFRWEEFGDPATGPSRAHLAAVNRMMATLRAPLHTAVREVRRAAEAPDDPEPLLRAKARAHRWVRATEQVWDFYLDLFNQRQTAFAPWLVAGDRIALDCYQYAFLGLGRWRSIPTPQRLVGFFMEELGRKSR